MCTLLLQQGYRVDYAAASDALTYCPEGFNEFFNQRRRWMPSTLANIIDLLGDAQNTVLVNDNISYLYILYQGVLLAATILGPGTIILAIATAFEAVLHVDLWVSYVLSCAPVLFYITVCFWCKTKTQLTIGAFLSTLYAVIMVVVLVGIIQSAVTETLLNPSLFFTLLLTVCFLFAGIMHPYEIFCLSHGILYYLAIPAGYLILTIYSMSNLHVVSWGTRETPKKKRKSEVAAEQQQAQQQAKKQKKGGFLSFLRPNVWLSEIRDTVSQAMTSKESGKEAALLKELKLLRKAQRKQNKLMKRFLDVQQRRTLRDTSSSDSDSDEEKTKKSSQRTTTAAPVAPSLPPDDVVVQLDDPNDPNWIKDPDLSGPVDKLTDHERTFWEQFIKKYLKPLKKDAKKEAADSQALLELRTNVSSALWMLNFLWILFNYMIQINPNLNTIVIFGLETQPAGFVFMILFVAVLVMQVIGMIIHRWGTFMQVMAATEVQNPFRKRSIEGRDPADISPKEAIAYTGELQKAGTKKFPNEPPPDYSDEDIPTPDYDCEDESGGTRPPRGAAPGREGLRRRWSIDRELIGTLRRMHRSRPAHDFDPRAAQPHPQIEMGSRSTYPAEWDQPFMSRGRTGTVGRNFQQHYRYAVHHPHGMASHLGYNSRDLPHGSRDPHHRPHDHDRRPRRAYTRTRANQVRVAPNELERQLHRHLNWVKQGGAGFRY